MTATNTTKGRGPKPKAPEPVREELLGLEDVLGKNYPKALTWAAPGDMHELVVAGLGVEQDRDYDTGDPLFWDDGRPKKIVALFGPADGADPGTWWVRGRRAERALREALREAGVRSVATGDTVTIVRGDDEEVPPKSGKGKSVWANTYSVAITLGTAQIHV